MENNSKQNSSKKVHEPATVSKPKTKTEQSDAFDYLPTYVKERLEKSLQESEKGLGNPHAQVMAEVKAKYNLK